METVYALANDKMTKTISALQSELDAIRAGRANAKVLDPIRVDYWGVPTPINQMAAVTVSEARILVIQPWDKSSLKLIEKAIQTSDLGINPQNDGVVIRLTFPPLTEERRKQLTKDVKAYGETAKVGVRKIRQECNDKLKGMKKANEITEDDLSQATEKVQKIHDKFIKKVEEVCDAKEKELLEI